MSCSPVDEALAWKLGVTLLALKGTKRERCEQILVFPSSTETEEKLSLTFRKGFRRRWRCKEGKKSIFFPPSSLHPQSKLPSLPWLGGSCGLRRRIVLPTRSPYPFRVFLCCSSAVSELAAVVGKKRRVWIKETGCQSLSCRKQAQYILILTLLETYNSLKGSTSSDSTCLAGVDPEDL